MRSLYVLVLAVSLQAFVAVADTAASVARPNPSRRVNIHLIVADDLGYGDLGCSGATKIKTPPGRPVRVSVGRIFSYFGRRHDQLETDLREFLNRCVKYDLPVLGGRRVAAPGSEPNGRLARIARKHPRRSAMPFPLHLQLERHCAAAGGARRHPHGGHGRRACQAVKPSSPPADRNGVVCVAPPPPEARSGRTAICRHPAVC